MKEALALLLYNYATRRPVLNIALSELHLVFSCSLKRDSVLEQTTQQPPGNKAVFQVQDGRSAWAGAAAQGLLQEVSVLARPLHLASELEIATSGKYSFSHNSQKVVFAEERGEVADHAAEAG